MLKIRTAAQKTTTAQRISTQIPPRREKGDGGQAEQGHKRNDVNCFKVVNQEAHYTSSLVLPGCLGDLEFRGPLRNENTRPAAPGLVAASNESWSIGGTARGSSVMSG